MGGLIAEQVFRVGTLWGRGAVVDEQCGHEAARAVPGSKISTPMTPAPAYAAARTWFWSPSGPSGWGRH
ncbi:MAG: hypothetical protein R2709_00610 [Marmoricola sp.]